MQERVLVTYHVPESDFNRNHYSEAAIIIEASGMRPFATVNEPMLYEIGDFENADKEIITVEEMLDEPHLTQITFLEREL